MNRYFKKLSFISLGLIALMYITSAMKQSQMRRLLSHHPQ